MTKIILNGCNGKMGQAISRLVWNDPDTEISAGLDLAAILKNPYPVYTNLEDCREDADVIIDFSHPSALAPLLEFAQKRGLPVVVATTGLSDAQKLSLEATSKKIPIFFSANMSLGVNLLIALSKKAAAILGDDFDIEIIEKHHNQKLDAPSGTALAIADGISEVLSNPPEYIYDRHSVRRKRKKNEIGLHAVRGGTIVGEHDVLFAGTNEVITLSHSAQSREVFAAGAVRAAKFLAGKPAGMYSMNDLFGTL